MLCSSYKGARAHSLILFSGYQHPINPTKDSITGVLHCHRDRISSYNLGRLLYSTPQNKSIWKRPGLASFYSMTQAGQGNLSSMAASSGNYDHDLISQPPTAVSERQDVLQQSRGEDHIVTRRHRLSQRFYPKDCPPLKVRWFYAVDSPKRKPTVSDHERKTKPLPTPKKFVPFSVKDSQSIEAAFQKVSESDDEHEQQMQYKHSTCRVQGDLVKVPVNEDYLFDVNIEERELAPAYWEGPVYEVRRGTWFYQEGSSFKPCSETLATQLEEGYVKLRPWRFHDVDKHPTRHPGHLTKHDHNTSSGKTSLDTDSHLVPSIDSHPLGHNEKHDESVGTAFNNENPTKSPTYRLFGSYMNNIVTYQDSSTALVTSDDLLSRVSTTVYQTLGGIAGTRVIRGLNETKKQKDNPDTKGSSDRKSQDPSNTSGKSQASLPHKHELDALQPGLSDDAAPMKEKVPEANPRSTLERQMSSLAGEPLDAADLEEQARKQEEKEMEDSREVENEDRERGIDHLILVTHGIGQRLGLRLESINFIHDVNVLRKSLKSVYKASPDLQALNSAFPDHDRNCRIQVLPV